MINLFKKDKFQEQVTNSLVKNCLFDKGVVFRQRGNSFRGIKLLFRDETVGMLWSIDGKKYVFNYQAFDTIIKLPINQEHGDQIWSKFLFTFQNKYDYEDV
jgi:hypothetical protein